MFPICWEHLVVIFSIQLYHSTYIPIIFVWNVSWMTEIFFLLWQLSSIKSCYNWCLCLWKNVQFRLIFWFVLSFSFIVHLLHPFFINLCYYENTNDHYHPCVLLVLEGDLVRKPTAYTYWSSSGLDFTEDAKNGTKIFGYADHIHKYR